MFVKQFFIQGIAHSSYLLGGSGHCAIIDPRRDIDIYLKAAKEMDMEITCILETHLHADFASGHMDLARITGAAIYAPGDCGFNHIPVKEGNSFEIDHLKIQVMETPGHTPEHVSYVVTDTSRGDKPVSLFCGDTLFVGDVGRPDLFPGIAKKLAAQLYHSLHDKLLTLPDFCEVYPAHGAGSLCGRAMGAKRSSTIGYEKLYNQALLITGEEEFINSLTTRMPPAPDHFSRLSAFNAAGPELILDKAPVTELRIRDFKREMQKERVQVLDIRSYAAFGGAHIPGSLHIDLGGNFATFAAWVIPPDKEILLVSDSPAEAREAARWLHRVGLDNVNSCLEGSIFNWCKQGEPVEHVPQVSGRELHQILAENKNISIIDVRAPKEFEANHIPGAVNIPAPDLRTRHNELPAGKPHMLICSTGHRSSLGCSILKSKGFQQVSNVAGGMTAYGAVCQ